MRHRWVRDFSQGDASMRDLLGGKGANLAEMTRMGLPVPPGFTITTAACVAHLEAGGSGPDGLEAEVETAMSSVEAAIGRRFGGPDDPLLVSVRSGARVSMPGMMDTVLDVGLNPQTVKGLAQVTGDEQFAADCWRRFTEMFSGVVLGVSTEELHAVRDHHLAAAGVADASELDAAAANAMTLDLRAAAEEHLGGPFPDEPMDQLHRSVRAVFASWDGARARAYRDLNGLPHDTGTAVNVQSMVFGNLDHSGTGVVFTRDPATGEPVPYGDVLIGAQGEDVVAGIRNTLPFAELHDHHPEAYEELLASLRVLEDRYREMCDVEFTIEREKLWVLQTRTGQRSARAAVRIAVDMAHEGLIDRAEALRRVSPVQLERLLHPTFDPTVERQVLTRGLAAAPGAASGEVVLTAEDAVERAADGTDVILVREETSPEDVAGMAAARGILTTRGGLVSHAAVVARGMGRPAVVGAAGVDPDVAAGTVMIGDVLLHAGDTLSIDGTTGEVVLGRVPVVAPEPDAHVEVLLGWADDTRELRVHANADTPQDATEARLLGAEGIGLCRTEHQFLGDRLSLFRDVVLASDEAARIAPLERLAEVQREDFVGILEAMDGLPVTVRLLDPPLHEFLPDVEDLRLLAATGEADAEQLRLLDAAQALREHNPMLGTRGVRLGVLLPELYRAQVVALTQAALQLAADGHDPQPEVMIPLVSTEEELAAMATLVRSWIAETIGDADLVVPVGTMIETPRAAIIAGDLVEHAEFCSFGTNDLTQLTYGLSRDDVATTLIPAYLAAGLFPDDPFSTLDEDGVGRLVSMAVDAVRAAAPPVTLAVCGEHAGDPRSIHLLHRIGVDHLSCSPPRLPVARLAAARAALGADAL